VGLFHLANLLTERNYHPHLDDPQDVHFRQPSW
jgi:hypothetical protein